MRLKFSAFTVVLFAFCNIVAAQSSELINKVSVLNFGYVTPIDGRGFLPGAQDDGARKVASTISLVQGKDIVLVADPGMTTKDSWNSVLEQLNLKGVTPEDVTHVFISHHHPDHITRLGLFPNATAVDFWGSYKDDVWSDHPDNYELAPGITVIRTPGHTHQDASLLVDTLEGTYALTHLWWTPGYEPKKDPLAEDHHQLDISRKLILDKADWIVPGHGTIFRNSEKQVVSVSEENASKVRTAVEIATNKWLDAFNAGNAAVAAEAYEADAVMTAIPLGKFTGRSSIQAFWQGIFDNGYSDGQYIEPKIEVLNKNSALVSSRWKMNKGSGIITKELWVLQENGEAKLRIDNFEIISN